MKKFYLTATSMFNSLNNSLSHMIHNNGERIVKLREHVKHNMNELEKRVAELEQQLKVMHCDKSGHVYTKWERIEEDTMRIFTFIPLHVLGTCEDCGHTKRIYPQHMKPAEKKMFIDMGILFKDDFPQKKKKK